MPPRRITFSTLPTPELLMKLSIMKYIALAKAPRKETDFTKTLKRSLVNSAESMESDTSPAKKKTGKITPK
jgi:hypothetical protein